MKESDEMSTDGPIPTLSTEEIVAFRNFYALAYEGAKRRCRKARTKIADDRYAQDARRQVEASNRILSEREGVQS
jgi:hypothetical protein